MLKIGFTFSTEGQNFYIRKRYTRVFLECAKAAGYEDVVPYVLPIVEDPYIIESFAKEMGIRLPEGYPMTFGGRLYWAPWQMPDIGGIKVLRPGLELGEMKKDRFEPAHALALWLKQVDNSISFSAESAQLAAYMHGETVPCDRKGWCLVCVDGFSLGWGKADGNVLKNHYPKGLRR